MPTTMRIRQLRELLYFALFLPILLTMCVLFVHMNTSLEAIRRPYPLKDWGQNVSRNLSIYVLPNARTLLMMPHKLNCAKRIFLLIVVYSAVESTAARQRIRRTWGNITDFNYEHFEAQHLHMRGTYLETLPERLKLYKRYTKSARKCAGNLPVRVVFLTGSNANQTQQQLLVAEQKQYDDIVQQDFVDTYKNLTIKSVMMLKWLTRSMKRQKIFFVMKSDEDVFVNVPNLLHFLLGGTLPLYNVTLPMYERHSVQVLASFNRLNWTRQLMVGYKHCEELTRTDVEDKFYIPYYMFKSSKYPDYLAGPGYILSGDVVPKLYQKALQTELIHIEDIFITGILAKSLNVRRFHNPLFAWHKEEYLYESACILKGCILMHWKSEYLEALYGYVKWNDNVCQLQKISMKPF